jgi:hypothetical protein
MGNLISIYLGILARGTGPNWLDNNGNLLPFYSPLFPIRFKVFIRFLLPGTREHEGLSIG